MKKHNLRVIERNFNRTTTVVVLALGILPLLTFALVESQERMEVQHALDVAIADASQEYQKLRSLPALERRSAAEAQAATAKVLPLMREKSALRRRVAALQDDIRDHRWQEAIERGNVASLPEDEGRVALLLHVIVSGVTVLRETFAAGPSPDGMVAGAARGLLLAHADPHASAPDAEDVRIAATEAELTKARLALVALQEKTEEALRAEQEAEQKLKRVQGQLTRIRATAEEVHREVIRMQGALARIDAQIRSRIERELLEKGLLTPGAIDHDAIPPKPQFSWPVYGPLSAGFRDPAYRERFGIPHLGLDIVMGQGSPVHATADGMVFLARDGGDSGYSYVLVGHRGGYATLYGHLSAISVTAGQDLRHGAMIGLSGGEIGAHGSGPTTTGPHLHFEVLVNGKNVDPRSVLP
jgi:murein DD-endopeptidase MepM/ murein hydrolase activator NlpD